jgi:hypothetical protein
VFSAKPVLEREDNLLRVGMSPKESKLSLVGDKLLKAERRPPDRRLATRVASDPAFREGENQGASAVQLAIKASGVLRPQ